MSTRQLLALVALCGLLHACASTPGSQVGTAAFAEQQKQVAIKLEAQGKTAQALAYWQTLLPLRSSSEEAKTAVRRLKQILDKEVAENLRKARQSYSAGNSRRGDTYMLKVLADKPGHKEALKRLGSSYSKKAQAQQANKSAQETAVKSQPTSKAVSSANQQMRKRFDKGDYKGVLKLSRDTGSSATPEMIQLLGSSHIALADASQKRGDKEQAALYLQQAIAIDPARAKNLQPRVQKLNKELAQEWYEQGVRQLKSDLPAAISTLQKAVAADSTHNDAKRKLLQAQTLQRNLEKIEKSR